jgi:hypothetical protein
MTTRLTPVQIQLMKDELTTELAGYLLDGNPPPRIRGKK